MPDKHDLYPDSGYGCQVGLSKIQDTGSASVCDTKY